MLKIKQPNIVPNKFVLKDYCVIGRGKPLEAFKGNGFLVKDATVSRLHCRIDIIDGTSAMITAYKKLSICGKKLQNDEQFQFDLDDSMVLQVGRVEIVYIEMKKRQKTIEASPDLVQVLKVRDEQMAEIQAKHALELEKQRTEQREKEALMEKEINERKLRAETEIQEAKKIAQEKIELEAKLEETKVEEAKKLAQEKQELEAKLKEDLEKQKAEYEQSFNNMKRDQAEQEAKFKKELEEMTKRATARAEEIGSAFSDDLLECPICFEIVNTDTSHGGRRALVMFCCMGLICEACWKQCSRMRGRHKCPRCNSQVRHEPKFLTGAMLTLAQKSKEAKNAGKLMKDEMEKQIQSSKTEAPAVESKPEAKSPIDLVNSSQTNNAAAAVSNPAQPRLPQVSGIAPTPTPSIPGQIQPIQQLQPQLQQPLTSVPRPNINMVTTAQRQMHFNMTQQQQMQRQVQQAQVLQQQIRQQHLQPQPIAQMGRPQAMTHAQTVAADMQAGQAAWMKLVKTSKSCQLLIVLLPVATFSTFAFL
eukprot:TRINITY_DN1622_c0_g1_i1.p1 TRINITY_DN1622_c0_g1~~TRINITY_DN1622_c0_g1_i1.p1  ORF type:complete len:532 (-),score=135.19 TRINITY_DN1622_c0_g1_i1:13-1608(-)